MMQSYANNQSQNISTNKNSKQASRIINISDKNSDRSNDEDKAKISKASTTLKPHKKAEVELFKSKTTTEANKLHSLKKAFSKDSEQK
mmetsp:Transcript_28265/g.24980  ORF Transcript_28265/g.24980 Transcript_28265/m.24980 type:complete len:88 (+) Transcript_28265:270-533(+)